MKIRILGNSLRLRLSQSEIQTFLKFGRVKETISFGAASFKHLHYMVKKADVSEIMASFYNNEIAILVPSTQVDNWIKSDQVTIEKEIRIGRDETLKILIEKDFNCLNERVGEDESDLFPNPARHSQKG